MNKQNQDTALSVITKVRPVGTELAARPRKGSKNTSVLTRNKTMVLEGLMAGRSVDEVAEDTHVPRRTIYNWLRYDAVFRAAYNQWKNSVEEHTRGRLLAMMDNAVVAIGQAIDGGDAKLAMQLLKNMKAFEPATGDRPITVSETQDEIKNLNERSRTLQEIAELKLRAERGIAKMSSVGWNRPPEETTIRAEIKAGAIVGEEDNDG